MAFPATYNFNYYSGDTFEFLIYPKDSLGGVFDDLAEYSSKFTIAESRGGDPILDSTIVTTSGSAAVPGLNATTGSASILCEIIAEYGAYLTKSSYVYDVQIQRTDKIYTLATGTITVLQDVAG